MMHGTDYLETVETDNTHKKDTACGLYLEGHKIATRFHQVLEQTRDALDTDVNILAGGCDGCATYDIEADAYLCYIAQSHSIDSLLIGYGAISDDSIKRIEIARELVATAKRLDVEVGWNSDADKKVCLGDAGFYDN